jgi:hypothetical protein
MFNLPIHFGRRPRVRLLSTFVLAAALLAMPYSSTAQSTPATAEQELQALRDQLGAQKTQIEQLKAMLDAQAQLLDRLAGKATAASAPAGPAATDGNTPLVAASKNDAKIEELSKKTESIAKSLGGFQFSGDFRFRADAQLRSGNSFAGPLQNVRGRYRVRLNIDKDIDPRFRFHLQLSTAPFTNYATNDQDMAGLGAKHPFSISEAYVDFHPNKTLSIRGGRMEEVFADSMRFLWDDDLRLNGAHQIVKIPLGAGALGFDNLELRAGEYILSNPAVYVLAANSPYVAAGYAPGGKVRDANLFHPGFVLRGNLNSKWSQQVTGGVELYRNPNQILLASSATGSAVLVTPAIGITLPSGVGQGGNATTLAGGAIYNAPHYQVVHFGYRLDRKSLHIGGREMPAFLDFQASRNVGTSRLQDAFIASANLGAVKKFGDFRLLYQFAIKDANSMISQFTDDDLGTGSGVNIAVHALRFDLGLARFLQWQNLLFIQDPRTGNDPANHIFVAIPRGANTTFRYLGQLAFTF